MKREELFIGAWANYLHTEDGVAPYKEPIRISAEDMCRDECVIEAHFEPIPFTPENLEKNGWVVDFKNEFSTRFVWVLKPRPPKERIDTTVEILLCDEEQIGVKCLVEIQCSSSNKGINLFHSCDCENIHQLQAAMRLCGIEKEIVI